MNEIYHHGIVGMHWGIRRYQNSDGSLTNAGRKRYLDETGEVSYKGIKKYQKDVVKSEKLDPKWAKKNYETIYNKTYKKSKKEMEEYLDSDLNKRKSMKNESGSYSMSYINEYNKKLADIMTKNSSDLSSPSGKVVTFIAKRGDIGVHMALADPNYDLNQVKNGIYGSGRVAYKKKVVDKV